MVFFAFLDINLKLHYKIMYYMMQNSFTLISKDPIGFELMWSFVFKN